MSLPSLHAGTLTAKLATMTASLIRMIVGVAFLAAAAAGITLAVRMVSVAGWGEAAGTLAALAVPIILAVAWGGGLAGRAIGDTLDRLHSDP